MTVLRREDILEAVRSGNLTINPFDEEMIEPASYDLALGKILKAGEGVQQLEDGEDFTLESNAWASIASKELITIPDDMCATYGLRSVFTRRGLIYFGGPQIDPGYNGRIYVSIYNPTLEPIILRIGEPLYTLILMKLTGVVGKPYDGSFQNQTNFPAEDVERMMRIRSKNLSDVIDTVETLDINVTTLSENLRILTGDVHEIKEAMTNLQPLIETFKKWGGWLLKVGAFVSITVVIAAVTYIVEQMLGG